MPTFYLMLSFVNGAQWHPSSSLSQKYIDTCVILAMFAIYYIPQRACCFLLLSPISETIDYKTYQPNAIGCMVPSFLCECALDCHFSRCHLPLCQPYTVSYNNHGLALESEVCNAKVMHAARYSQARVTNHCFSFLQHFLVVQKKTCHERMIGN